MRKEKENLQKQKEKFEEKLATRTIDEQYVAALRDGFKPASRKALYFNLLFLARRLLLIVCAIWLQHYAAMQVLVTFLATEAMMIFTLSVKPFEEPRDNLFETMNECIVLLALYHHAILLAFYWGEQATKTLGITLNVTIGLPVLLFIGILAYNGVNWLKNECKKRQLCNCKRLKKRRLKKRRPPTPPNPKSNETDEDSNSVAKS